ncbi:MAG: glycosyltransferase family 4 protein [Bacteroidota bacterium]
MHILLFYQYYHNPDCAASGRHFQFVKALSKNHRVSIITSDIWQKKRQTNNFAWAPPGVEVHQLAVPYENAMGNAARLKAYAGYMWKAFWQGLKIDRPDVIIGSSTPLTAAWAAAKVARFRRIPWVFEVRDLWPDFPIQMGAIKHGWLRRRLYKIEENLYSGAAHNIALSPDMASHIAEKGVGDDKISVLLNGTDLNFANTTDTTAGDALRQAHGLAGKKIVLYAGTLGRANAIPQILETSSALQHREDIHFVLLGSGFFEAHIRRAVAAQQNLSLIEAAPRHQVFDWFRAATVSLVSFINLPVLATNSPAKFFDSLAAGTPVIVTNPGWTRAFVAKHNCGWYAPWEEPEALVRCIENVIDDPGLLSTAGKNGSTIAAELFDRSKMALQLETILRQCALPQGELT